MDPQTGTPGTPVGPAPDPPPQTARPSPVAAAAGAAPEAAAADKGFYDAYASFSRTLRGWLIAYGVGGPVLFATQPTLGERLARVGIIHQVVLWFLAGVGVQILAALLYKTAMWYAYVGELESAFQSTRRYKVASWLSDQFWLELLFDVVAIGFFGAATTCIVVSLT